MSWEVVFYNLPSGRSPVQDWLHQQSPEVQAACIHYVELLEDKGTSLTRPHAAPVRDKLYELRISASSGIFRTLYFGVSGRRFVIVHAFQKKTKKISNRDIDLALTRMRDFLLNDVPKPPTS